MKKKLATLFLLAAVMTTTTFATTIDGNVNQSVLKGFNQRFAQAKAVTWTKADEYVKASFSMNGQMMFAYFDASGELIGVCRNIVTSQLPINLQTQLTDALSTGWVSELFEFASDSETSYFITVESADAQTTLKGSGNASWVVYKKAKKN